MKQINEESPLVEAMDIKNAGFKWAMIDNAADAMRKARGDSVIVNTDTSDGPGIHWMLWYMLPDNIVYIYDPLGAKNIKNWKLPLNDALIPSSGFPLLVRIFPGKSQTNASVLCGYFSIHMAEIFKREKPETPNECEKLIAKEFGKSADYGDVRKLEPTIREVLGRRNQTGSGLVAERINGFFQFLTGKERRNFKPSMRTILSAKGDIPIKYMMAVRVPLARWLDKFIDMTNRLQSRRFSHDQLFHLFFVIVLANGESYRLEKNQELNLVPYDPRKKPKHSEFMHIPLEPSETHTMNELLSRAIHMYGADDIFHYDATNNNCQRFLIKVLRASGIPISSELQKFIMQPTDFLIVGWAKKLTDAATGLANRFGLIKYGKGGRSVIL